LIDTTPRDGADLDPDRGGPTWRDSARFIAVFVLLLGLALVLMAATHEPGCGGPG
jgi:hypothetical protein